MTFGRTRSRLRCCAWREGSGVHDERHRDGAPRVYQLKRFSYAGMLPAPRDDAGPPDLNRTGIVGGPIR